MRWRESLAPRRMARVAVVAPESRWRTALVAVADAGVVEVDIPVEGPRGPAAQALERLRRQAPASPAVPARVSAGALDVARAEEAGRVDLLAGEAELERVGAAAVTRHDVRALAGWAPAETLPALAERLAPLGASVVELPIPRGVDPPTLLAAGGAAERLRPLVATYATVAYRDVDPTWFAAAAYVVMFGMMFGDVGDGLVLVAGAWWLRRTRRPALAGYRGAWPLVAALGVAAVGFGFLYGEAFGPTGLVAELWLSPLDEPTRLLTAAVGVGAALLAVAYLLGTVNRLREGGVGLALYAPSGVAGTAVFAAAGLVAAGVWAEIAALWVAGLAVGAGGLVLAAVGLRAAAGPGAAGAVQAGVELFDLVVRLGANVVSFARLAAFGLTHAAVGKVVWDATVALWQPGPVAAGAVVVFLAGHVVAFALEALVAGVQALRLEYYELFSRIFVAEGRPFRPWHVPTAAGADREERAWSPG